SLPERIVGTWTVDVIEVDPKSSTGRGESKATITFEKEQETGAGFFGMFMSSGFDPRFKSGAYKTGPRVGPEYCEFELLPDNDNKHYVGVYEFRGDSVWMCISPAGFMPRRDFAAPPGSGKIVLRLEREMK